MKTLLNLPAVILALCAGFVSARSQSTAFTYQGRLDENGSSANGSYDLRFAVYGATNDPAPLVAGPLTNAATPVSNGLFTVRLDFGGGVFDGSERWLEIAVRTNGLDAFTALAPWQPLTAAPHAIMASSASNLLGTVPASQVGGTLSFSQLPGVLVTNNQTGVNLSGSFTGDGVGLTNLPVDSLVRITTNSLIVGWGQDGSGQATAPVGLSDVTSLAAGFDHSLALRSDGTVVAWGFGRATIVPPGLNGVTAVSASLNHSVALRMDGTVVAWGENDFGQTNIPPSWTNIVAIAAGGEFNVALKADGTVVARGRNNFGQTNVPAGLNGVTSVAAGFAHVVALRTDGTLRVWGQNDFGQTNVPPGLTNVVAIASGWTHLLALRSDGRLVAWGQNGGGQTNVPAGLSNVVAMAGGMEHSVALRSDGSVVAWGRNNVGQTNVPAGLDGVVALAPGPAPNHVLVIRKLLYSPVAWLAANNTFEGINTFQRDIHAGGAIRSEGIIVGSAFSGNGSGLTNLNVNATDITSGTLADARLSGNVALLNSSPAFRGQTFAAGARASANHNGAFVWADSQAADFASERNDQFRARANGGVRFDINATHWVSLYTFLDTGFIAKVIDTSTGAYLTTGGSWVNNSDRAAKENVRPVDGETILDALAALPISSWNYRNEHAGVRHIGPMAQDFHAAFGAGADERHIATVDADGVALAAIQSLHQKLEEQRAGLKARDAELSELRLQQTELQKRLADLEKAVGRLAGQSVETAR